MSRIKTRMILIYICSTHVFLDFFGAQGFLPAVRKWRWSWVEDPRQMIYMWNVLTATWITWITWVWLECFAGVSCGRLQKIPSQFQPFRWTHGVGSIPIFIPFLGEWTSIYYFDVNYRGTIGFDTLPNEIHHHVLWGTSSILVVHGSFGNWIDDDWWHWNRGFLKMAAPPWESDVDGMPMAYHITPDRDIGYVCQAWLKLVWITLSFCSNWDHSTTFHLTPRGSGSVFPMLPKTSFCPLESDPICRSWVSHLLYVLLARQRGPHVQ